MRFFFANCSIAVISMYCNRPDLYPANLKAEVIFLH